MKQLFFIILSAPLFLHAQLHTLSLTDAYDLAIKNYPSLKQKDLLKQSAAININNLSKAFLPQLNISGQASYQSDVTKITLPIPNLTVPSLSKDQYKVITDISQLIYAGGAIEAQKNVQQLNENVEQQKLEVELYQVKDKINQLFLGILFLDEQIKQLSIVKKDLITGFKTTNALVKNGVSFKSNIDVFSAEILKTDEQEIELNSAKKNLLDILSIYINQPLSEEIKLEKPLVETSIVNNTIQRPELHLFAAQQKLFDGQYKIIATRNKPKASAFLQTGYGRPGINMLNNNFAFFYIGGVRLNWAIGDLYTKKNDKKLIDINKKSIEIVQQNFLLNSNIALKQQQGLIEKLQQLSLKDNEIITLREKIKVAANAQLQNGVITANDFLKEINAEDMARQQLIAHQIQLLQAQINYKTILGNQ